MAGMLAAGCLSSSATLRCLVSGLVAAGGQERVVRQRLGQRSEVQEGRNAGSSQEVLNVP